MKGLHVDGISVIFLMSAIPGDIHRNWNTTRRIYGAYSASPI